MIILAVVVGYLLGVAPFVIPKIIQKVEDYKAAKVEAEEEQEKEEIFDEWLNGLKEQKEPEALVNEPKQVDQHDLFEEYVTGKVKGA